MLELPQVPIAAVPGLLELTSHVPVFRFCSDSAGNLSAEGWGILAGVGSSAFCFLMYLVSRWLTPLVSSTYRTLSIPDKRNWDTRYSSNIHSALCVYFAYQLLYKSDFFWKDSPVPMVLRTSPATYLALGISCGYFVVDFWSCVKYNLGGMEMLLHHMGSLLAVMVALVTGNGHMHTLWMLVTEFTTPLINNRWWLDKMGMKSHVLYVINGLSILFSWIFARMMVFPPFFFVVWQTRDQIWELAHISKVLMVLVPAILTVLNTFWFFRIVKGAYKVLFHPKAKEQ